MVGIRFPQGSESYQSWNHCGQSRASNSIAQARNGNFPGGFDQKMTSPCKANAVDTYKREVAKSSAQGENALSRNMTR